MQTQITKTYQLTALRMAISKNAANNKCGEMRTLGSKWDVVRATNENTVEVLWKGKHWATSQSVNTHCWAYLLRQWESKGTGWQSCAPAILTIADAWKQRKCPSTEECTKKKWSMHTMEYYSTRKYELKKQTWVRRHKLWGLYQGTWQSNWYLRNTTGRKVCRPRYQSGHRRKAAGLWPIPATAAWKSVRMVTSYAQVLQGCKGNLPSKCPDAGKGQNISKCGTYFKKTIWRRKLS